MPSVAFALPVKSTDKGQELIKALTGESAGTHHERTSAHGFRRVKVFRQHRPQEMVVIYLEADDLEAAMRERMRDDHEHTKWWAQMVEEVTGHRPGAVGGASGAPSELLIDWHPTHGVSKGHHD